jgi:hypothetical protein
MCRLEALWAHLAAKIERSSVAKQRAASLAACEFAISHAKVEHPLVQQALQKLRAGGVFSLKEKADLDALIVQLDDEYFGLQEAAEEGRANTADYLRLFGQARAVAALAFAGGEDAFQAATESIYEAVATTDNKDELSMHILSVLDDGQCRES